MLDVAIRKADGTVAVDPLTGRGRRAAPPLPVDPALAPVLPDGLRRGTTVEVTGSLSLLLALLGAASADGAWCALVGFAQLSAEAADEYGIVLPRLAVVPSGDRQWATAVGALIDAVDVVATRVPRRLAPGEARRLAARARTRDAVLVAFGGWPGSDVRLAVTSGPWAGIGRGYGRLRARRVAVTATGRGRAARPRAAQLWLPAAAGGVEPAEPLAPVVPLVS